MTAARVTRRRGRSLAGFVAVSVVSAVMAFAPAAGATGGAVVSGVTITGSAAAPVVVVTGSGFGTEPVGSHAGCGATGNNFKSLLYFQDVTRGWAAGRKTTTETDCIGLVVSAYTDTEIDFTFGNFYGTDPAYTLADGDQYVMQVAGGSFSGTAHWPTITSVAITGTVATPTITVHGTNFGTKPPGTPVSGDTGDTFRTSLWFDNHTGVWEAGNGADANLIGLLVSSYSATKIVFQFGSFYGGDIFSLHPGDSYTMHVRGATFDGVASYPTMKATGELDGVGRTGRVQALGDARRADRFDDPEDRDHHRRDAHLERHAARGHDVRVVPGGQHARGQDHRRLPSHRRVHREQRGYVRELEPADRVAVHHRTLERDAHRLVHRSERGRELRFPGRRSVERRPSRRVCGEGVEDAHVQRHERTVPPQSRLGSVPAGAPGRHTACAAGRLLSGASTAAELKGSRR
jgi:hypothetical protein